MSHFQHWRTQRGERLKQAHCSDVLTYTGRGNTDNIDFCLDPQRMMTFPPPRPGLTNREHPGFLCLPSCTAHWVSKFGRTLLSDPFIIRSLGSDQTLLKPKKRPLMSGVTYPKRKLSSSNSLFPLLSSFLHSPGPVFSFPLLSLFLSFPPLPPPLLYPLRPPSFPPIQSRSPCSCLGSAGREPETHSGFDEPSILPLLVDSGAMC